MKKNLLIAFLLVVLLVSCSFSAQDEKIEENKETKNLVKVGFIPASTKSLDATYQDVATTYYLTAIPKFSRGERSIVGAVQNEKLTKNQNDDCYNGGFFEQGRWDFTINACYEKGNVKTVVATKTLKDAYVSAKTNVFDVFLEDHTEAGTGSATISVKVPKVSEYDKTLKTYGVTLTVLVEGNSFAFANGGPVITEVSGTDITELLQFDGTIENIPAGCKNIQLIYKLGDKQISSQNIEVRIIKGLNVSISGSMLNEKYVEGSFIIVYETDLWEMSVEAEDYEIVPSEEGQTPVKTKVSCTITDLPQDSTVKYQWYLDGAAETGCTSSTYNFSSKAQGMFNVTCIATVNNFSKSDSVEIFVNYPQKKD